MLRFGLRVQREDLDRVTFRDEWAFVQSYLSLEQLRFGQRLQVVVDVADGVADVPIPPFALQTLVENAVNHGVAPRRDGGWLRVGAACPGGRLRVVVEDDGPGACEEEILASPRLGLRLLRDRLAVIFGDDARLAFERGERGGLLVRLDLPANRPFGASSPRQVWHPRLADGDARADAEPATSAALAPGRR
jgi:LytS/YehU family sensor histidine kinase